MKILSGIDIVSNLRMKKLIERSPDALKDIFSPLEIRYCKGKHAAYQSFSARFAVKEALIKAIDGDLLAYDLWKIETVNTETGKPELHIHCERIKEKIRDLLGTDLYSVQVTISHEKEYSVAQVLIY